MKKHKFIQIKKKDLVQIEGGNIKDKLDSALWSIIKIGSKNK